MHRFYYPQLAPETSFWVHDQHLIHQWLKVLRLNACDSIVIFDAKEHDGIYKIEHLDAQGAKLDHIATNQLKLPQKKVALFWSLLNKRSKDDLVIQKCTELGVSSFYPLITAHTQLSTLDVDRLHKIAVEASEQSGRSDIPFIAEPQPLHQALKSRQDSYEFLVCQQGEGQQLEISTELPAGILVGPEGGWSSQELEEFSELKLNSINLGKFTLRAETAAIVAVSKLV